MENLQEIVDDTVPNNALGTSTGVRGHGEAGRAGGTAPTARSQTSPFHIGMGETAKVAGNGGKAPRDGGAGDAGEVRRGGRASRSAAQHTAARWRIWTRFASTVTSPLSASRADEKQLPASPEQVRERRARVGGRRGGWCGKRGRCRGCASQEGRSAAEGDSVVGAYGDAARPSTSAAALRDGTARPRRPARRVTRAPRPRPRPRLPPPYHAYIPLSGRPEPRRRTRHASRSIIDLVFIYSHRRRRWPSVLLAPSLSFAKTKTEIK